MGELMVARGASRETRWNLMIQLVTMAFACDITRTVTFMMDDARSEFAYGHVPLRTFSGTTSTLATGVCHNYHGAQHGSDQEFSTITRWMAVKANQMAQALAAINEGAGLVLD